MSSIIPESEVFAESEVLLRRRLGRRRHCEGVEERVTARWLPSMNIGLLVTLLAMLLVGVGGEDVNSGVDCCSGQYAYADCSSGIEYLGKNYYCRPVDTAELMACATCLPPTDSSVQCSSCCGTTRTECDLEWSWGAVLVTLALSALFATCSGILALAESRRKRKGMSLARAYNVPQGMPVLRATVIDLSDAVRGRSFTWSSSRMDEENSRGDEELERVGLLEDFRHDSVYGALVGVGNANVPVAKVAEDDWVTATVAWRQANGSNTTLESGEGEEGRQASPASPPLSASRWRSARAIARRALRVGSSTTTPVASDVSEGPEIRVVQAHEVTPSSRERDPVVVSLEDPS